MSRASGQEEGGALKALQRAARRGGDIGTALLTEYGARLAKLHQLGSQLLARDIILKEIRISTIGREDGSYIVVVKADVAGTASVAFFSGIGPLEALLSCLGALESGHVRWKEDTPYDARRAR